MKTTETEKRQRSDAFGLGCSNTGAAEGLAVNAFLFRAVRIKVGVDPLRHYYIL